MAPTFTMVGDTFEDDFVTRKKYIHSVGSVAEIKFVPVDNAGGFTGLFTEEVDYGFVRFSAAKEPDTTKNTSAGADGNYVPAIGLKLFRDGIPSANVVAMYSVNGQPSWNPLAFNFSNHVPAFVGATAL